VVNLQEQTQLKKVSKEMEEFKKKHSESFIYFLEEYEKWQELKRKAHS